MSTHPASPPTITSPPTDFAPQAPRWPARYAWVTSWCRPATTTTRMAHVPLWAAFLVHAAALAVIMVCGTIVNAWFNHLMSDSSFADALLLPLFEFLREPGAILAPVLPAMSLSALFLIAAIFVAPYGARNERQRDSTRHALQRTWLQTPHLILVVLVVGLGEAQLEASRWEAYRITQAKFEETHSAPDVPENQNDRAAMNAYYAASRDYYEQQQVFIRREIRPGYTRWTAELSTVLYGAAIVWVVWALFRGVCAPRPDVPPARARLCRRCGYNLEGLPETGRCPECGTPTDESIQPNRRPLPWEVRAQVGRVRAYVQTAALSLRDPMGLGARLSVYADKAHAMRFLFTNALVTMTGICLIVLIVKSFKSADGPAYYFGAGDWMAPYLLASTLAALLFIGLTNSAAQGISAWARLHDHRPSLLAWAGQWAAYGSTFVMCWIMIAGLWTAVLILREEDLTWLAYAAGHAAPSLWYPAWLWILPNAAIALLFVRYCARGLAGVRYAWN